MRWPIRWQLLAPPLTLLLGVVGISTWTAYASADRAFRQTETQVRNVAHTLAEGHQFPLQPGVLEKMKGLSGAEFLFVTDDGRRLTTLPTGGAAPPPDEPVFDDWQALRLGPPAAVDGRNYLCGALRLPPRPPRDGGTLYILYPEALWRDALWQAVRPSLALGGFVGVASLALALGAGGRLSRRIGELERHTRRIAAGDFSPVPLPRRHDELRDLSRSVNEMAGQLARLRETVRNTERLRLLGQVSGGLAHQLRNGLTGARLALQLHARECQGGDAESLGVALRQLDLLEVQLKRFLDLGRAGSPRREPCSLETVVGEAVELLRPRCRHARIDLSWAPPAGAVPVLGDAGQLSQLAVNVLGNAVEAAGPGGQVEVRLGADSGPSAILEVYDSGPGVAPEVAERLFEPFVTGKPEGVGLGLAVARQVAEAHGGRITWRREEGRTCFRVELPRAGG